MLHGLFGKKTNLNLFKGQINMKTSDLCILVSVAVAFITTAYLWFNGQKEEGLFTATWIPSILTFAIYFKLITRK